MFCPNYKNKEVKNSFNEMVEALGGQPLTDEEFRSSELRNQRTGVNYSAMETAYKVYHRNGGNFLDLTPDGKKSILFQTLLDHFDGDIEAAIIAKSNVYSDEFTEWFGDWTAEEKENVSKVVDENGEPLVVWHGSNKDFSEFEVRKTRDFLYKSDDESVVEDIYSAFFFSSNKQYSSTQSSHLLLLCVSLPCIKAVTMVCYAKTNGIVLIKLPLPKLLGLYAKCTHSLKL